MSKYRFSLNGLDCANCANKIEEALKQDVMFEDAVVNFAASNVCVVTNENIENAKTEISKVLKKVEPETTLEDIKKVDLKLIQILLASILFVAGFFVKENLWIYLGCYFIIGYDILIKSIKNILRGELFDEFFLMTIATIGAFIIGEYPEGAAVMLFFQIGEYVQELAVSKSRKSITSLMDLKGEYANLVIGEESKKVDPGTVKVGDIILCKPGEKIPLDGTIIEGTTTVDTSALTGESIPRNITVGDSVFSGSVNINSVIRVEVTQIESETVVSKMLEMIENASEKKTHTERFITRFSKVYTPIIVLLGICICLIPTIIFKQPFDEWFYKSLVFLVISCPCALVISVPLGFFSGIGASSKRGVLMKGSDALEMLTKIEAIYFDKTGTLTEGNLKVSTIVTNEEMSSKRLLEYIASAEFYSTHPIKTAIDESLKDTDIVINEKDLKNYKEYPGKGTSVTYKKQNIVVGNKTLMEELKISVPNVSVASTIVYVAKDYEYLGYVVIEDKIKEGAKKTIQALSKFGISEVGILSGDNKGIVKEIASLLGIKKYYGELLPNEKADIIFKSKNTKKTMFVGDGLNDALVLTSSDLGVSMGSLGSDAAIEASDIVIMNDDITKLIDAFKIAKTTKHVIYYNIAFALLIKVIVLLLGVFGFTTIWLAVFADVGVTLITILNTFYIHYSIKKQH